MGPSPRKLNLKRAASTKSYHSYWCLTCDLHWHVFYAIFAAGHYYVIDIEISILTTASMVVRTNIILRLMIFLKGLSIWTIGEAKDGILARGCKPQHAKSSSLDICSFDHVEESESRHAWKFACARVFSLFSPVSSKKASKSMLLLFFGTGMGRKSESWVSPLWTKRLALDKGDKGARTQRQGRDCMLQQPWTPGKAWHSRVCCHWSCHSSLIRVTTLKKMSTYRSRHMLLCWHAPILTTHSEILQLA